MKQETYIDCVKNLRKDIYSIPIDEIKNMGLLGTYLIISANLLRYLPKLNNDTQYKVIQDIQFNRNLSIKDQYYFDLLNTLKVYDKSNIIENSFSKSFIFVTFHTGSYRLFLQLLSRKNVPFTLVTEERFIKEQGDTVKNIFKKLRENPNEELEILPAENPRLIFELVNRLKNGISVVFYIDGNTGATDKNLNENKNLLKIDFLNHHIYARQGVAYLVYLSKAPIAVAIAKRNKDLSNRLLIKPMNLNSLQKKNRTDFINIVTKKLYGELENFLRKYPEQWEGWFYIDKFFKTETLENNEPRKKIENFSKKVVLCIDEFIFLMKNGDEHSFLVSKKDYQIMQITDSLYEILDFFKTPRTLMPKKSFMVGNNNVEWNVITELLEMNFLKLL
jgi:lauroyl/myristoyl acyltransferase